MSDLPARGLTCRQATAYDFIEAYYAVTAEPCPVRLLARHIGVAAPTARERVEALWRKGWVRSPTGPAVPMRALRHPSQNRRGWLR